VRRPNLRYLEDRVIYVSCKWRVVGKGKYLRKIRSAVKGAKDPRRP
jgi:hypothetical protein